MGGSLPLYNIDEAAERIRSKGNKVQTLIVEDQDSVDLLRQITDDGTGRKTWVNAVCPPQHSGIDDIDWSPLHGSRVLILATMQFAGRVAVQLDGAGCDVRLAASSASVPEAAAGGWQGVLAFVKAAGGVKAFADVLDAQAPEAFDAQALERELDDDPPPLSGVETAEQAVLAAALAHGKVAPALFPNNFKHGFHKAIWSAIQKVGHDGLAVEPTAVVERMSGIDDDHLEYILQLVENSRGTANLAHYAKLVRGGEDGPDEWERFVRLRPLGDFMDIEIERPGFLIEDMLFMGGFSASYAPPKCGKSELVRNLVRSIARGQSFLGNNVNEPGTVVYFSFEEEDYQVQTALRRLGMKNEPVHVHVGRVEVPIVEILPGIIEQHEPAIIVLDTMLEAIPTIDDLNDYAKAKPEISKLRHVARETRTHIHLVHHSRKSGGQDGEAMLGSTAIRAEFDMLIELTRQGKDRYIQWEGRGGIYQERSKLSFDEDTGVVSVGQTMTQVTNHQHTENIMDYLATAKGDGGGWVRQSDIPAGANVRRQSAYQALRDLLREGLIEQTGTGERGDPLRFRLREIDDKGWK